MVKQDFYAFSTGIRVHDFSFYWTSGFRGYYGGAVRQNFQTATSWTQQGSARGGADLPALTFLLGEEGVQRLGRAGTRVFGLPVRDLANCFFRDASLLGDFGPQARHGSTQVAHHILDSFDGFGSHETRISHVWDLYNPQMGLYLRQSAIMRKTMSLEQILAKNLTALMARMPDVETIDKLSSRSGVGRGTVDRIKKGEVSTKIETVEKLAAALGVEPVQLLTENLDATIATTTANIGPVDGPELTYLQWITDQEAALLKVFRDLEKPDRKTALEIISVMPRASTRSRSAHEP
jgi:transcriptional regulator with XRE-family HTH domain